MIGGRCRGSLSVNAEREKKEYGREKDEAGADSGHGCCSWVEGIAQLNRVPRFSNQDYISKDF
jgi:hypothetical protein